MSFDKKTSKKSRGKTPRQREIDKLDSIFSKLVRIQHADKEGNCRCFTCGRIGYWTKGGIECGHYRSRGHMNTRWLVDNSKPQCIECNQILSGNLKVYTSNLGEELSDRLIQMSLTIVHWNAGDILLKRLEMKKQLSELRKKKQL